MGRLDNAMRRAAEEQAAKSVTGPSTLDDLVSTTPETASSLAAEPVEPNVPVVGVVGSVDVVSKAGVDGVAASVAAVSNLGVDGVAASVAAVADAPAEPSASIKISATLSTKTVAGEGMEPAPREQYRRLAAGLHQAQRTDGLKVVMVASAVAGEGKSLTAANLAMTLAGSYLRNVLLVDADLRRPSQHTMFQVPGIPGLSTGLLSEHEIAMPVHRLTPRLAVLPAGRPTQDPIGALTSERMRRLISEAREVFDWVIIDTPPVGLLTDAALLTSLADGVILVVKAETTDCNLVQRAIDAIGREHILGLVLNRAIEQPHGSAYDYYNYYGVGSSAPGAGSLLKH